MKPKGYYGENGNRRSRVERVLEESRRQEVRVDRYRKDEIRTVTILANLAVSGVHKFS